MFLRWARSNIRENLVMTSYVFGRFREGPMLGARINLLLQWVALIKPPFLLGGTFACLIMEPFTYFIQVLLGTILSSSLMATLYCWRERSSEGLWAYLYGIFWMGALFWINPYALLTPHKNAWLTRGGKNRQLPVAEQRRRHLLRRRPGDRRPDRRGRA